MKKPTKHRRKPTAAKRRKPQPAFRYASLLELHARTWAVWQRVAAGIEKPGGISRTQCGKVSLTPAFIAYVELATVLRGTLNDLEMTPAAAARVGAGRGPENRS